MSFSNLSQLDASMPNASLRHSGRPLSSTIPAIRADEQNRLNADSSAMRAACVPDPTVPGQRKRPSLEALLTQTPRGAQRAENWDTMAPAGREL